MTAERLGVSARGSAKRRRSALPPLWLVVPVGLLASAALLPLLYVVAQAAQTGWTRSISLLIRPFVAELMVNTLVLMAGVTGGSLCLGIGLAWLVERTQVPGRRLWALVLPLPLAVPSFVSGFAWMSLSARFEGLGSAIGILTLAEFPLVYLPVAVALRGLDQDLENVARSLGHGAWRCFFRVVLPQLRPALTGAALLIMLHMLVEFGPLALLRVDTFTTAIYAAYELDFDGAAAAMLSGVLLGLCGLMLAAELASRGRARFARIGAGAPRPVLPVELGLWGPPACVGVMLVMVLALGVPLLALCYWMVVGSSTQFPLARIGHALTGSLTLAGLGSVVTTAGGLALVLTSLRFRGTLALIAERLPFAIHALPGVVVALALVFFSLAAVPALYQTTAVLILAYSLLSLPLAQSAIRAILEQFPVVVEEVARSCGKAPWIVFRRITLPNISGGLAAAAVLVFLQLLKELTATLILAPTGQDTLSMEVWSHTAKMEYGAAAPYALLLVLVSGVPAYLFSLKLRRMPILR